MKFVVFVIFVSWFGLLFMIIGIVVSDFFSVNFSIIVSVLGLSESLVGVMFFVFGNGFLDVFSIFVVMGFNSGSMVVGELIGVVGFIIVVVVGFMVLVWEFKVSKCIFV